MGHSDLYLKPTRRDSIKQSNSLRSFNAAAAPIASASLKSSSGNSKLFVNAAKVYKPLAKFNREFMSLFFDQTNLLDAQVPNI